MDPGNKAIYTVNEFTIAVKKILTKGDFNEALVRGEISNFKNHNSGHRYFTLKDKNSQLQCVMFKWYGRNLRFEPENGMKVIVFGDLDVYEQKGVYQLKVRDIRPDGIGELYRAYELLKNRLAMEGLFSPDQKKSLPRIPKKIGIATSPTGAVLHDMLTVLGRRYPVNILFIPTIVQGESAGQSIVKSIAELNRTDVDVIIIGRGGGSIEDLWAFNEEAVARAIYESRIPVISAVGHETDYTIADFVADVRAPTPSAAAEIAVPDRFELTNRIMVLGERLMTVQKRFINERMSNIIDIGTIVNPQKISDRIIQYIQYVDELSQSHIRNMQRIIEIRESLIKAHSGKLNAVSPLGTLSRGYSITLKLPEKTTVQSINDVNRSDEVSIIVTDGRIRCNVKDKEECKL